MHIDPHGPKSICFGPALSHALCIAHFLFQHDAQLDFYSKRLATCSSDRVVRIIEADSRKCQAEIKWFGSDTMRRGFHSVCMQNHAYFHNGMQFCSHTGPVWQVSWAHPKFGVLLASCSYDRTVVVNRENSPGQWSPIYTYKEHEVVACFGALLTPKKESHACLSYTIPPPRMPPNKTFVRILSLQSIHWYGLLISMACIWRVPLRMAKCLCTATAVLHPHPNPRSYALNIFVFIFSHKKGKIKCPADQSRVSKPSVQVGTGGWRSLQRGAWGVMPSTGLPSTIVAERYFLHECVYFQQILRLDNVPCIVFACLYYAKFWLESMRENYVLSCRF